MADLFFNKTVTLWNCSNSDDVMEEEIWYPTVLENVRLIETKGRNVSTSGIKEADSAKLHILTSNLKKPYLEPKEWDALDDKSQAFTLCQEKDFFVKGDVSEIETVDNFFQWMKDHYDGVYQITTVDRFEVIPHLEVGGK